MSEVLLIRYPYQQRAISRMKSHLNKNPCREGRGGEGRVILGQLFHLLSARRVDTRVEAGDLAWWPRIRGAPYSCGTAPDSVRLAGFTCRGTSPTSPGRRQGMLALGPPIRGLGAPQPVNIGMLRLVKLLYQVCRLLQVQTAVGRLILKFLDYSGLLKQFAG